MKTPIGLEAKLPVWDLLQEAAFILWQKRVEITRLFLPVIVLLAGLDWLSGELQADGASSSQLIIILPSIMLSVLMATSCHQYTLQPNANPKVLRGWQRNDWRYLGRGVQIMLIALGVFFIAVVLGFMLFTQQEQIVLVSLLGLLPSLYIWGRLSIILPEVALGNTSTIKRAWSLSQGNGIRISLVVIGIPVLLMLPFLLLLAVDNTVLNLFSSLGTYLGTLVSLVTLSLSYRFLQEFHDGQSASSLDITQIDA